MGLGLERPLDDPPMLTPPAFTADSEALSGKENFSLVVLDSGLGGLSIFAAIEQGLRLRKSFNSATLTYYNAWPEQHRGYNSIPSLDARIQVFDRALAGTLIYAPDLLLIACNTLSVLYPQTAFSRTADFPVKGIVDLGVEAIHAAMKPFPDSNTLILGTLTTIEADVHRTSLMDKGIAPQRLAAQACDQLATAIESDPHSPRVQQMIAECTQQGLAQFPQTQGKTFAALCCTHYGYSAPYFKQSLARHGSGTEAAVIDPNQAMANYLLSRCTETAASTSTVNLNIVSRIKWNREKLAAMANAVQSVSPETSRALAHYHHNTELFQP
jgi:glutamate racemase